MKRISKKTVFSTMIVLTILPLVLGISLLPNNNENKNLPVYGKESSSNNIIVFGDFRCPYCTKWSEEVLPKLVDEYVQSGKLSISFANLAFVAEDSQTISKFGLAIAEQGDDKYWEFESKVRHYLKERPLVTENDLISFAKSELSEVDMKKLGKDLSDIKLMDRLNENIKLAKKYGITGTPQLVFNGKKATDLSYESLKGLLD